MSEIMTIIIYFHQSRYRNFKSYYNEHVCKLLRAEFPNLVSYKRFVALMSSAFGPLSAYLNSLYGMASAVVFLLQIRLLWRSVTITVSITTKYLRGLFNAVKVQWAGFMA